MSYDFSDAVNVAEVGGPNPPAPTESTADLKGSAVSHFMGLRNIRPPRQNQPPI
jgi:hypothetical protein